MRSLAWRALRALGVGALDLLWPVDCPVCHRWIEAGADACYERTWRSAPGLHPRCMTELEPARRACPSPRSLATGIPVWWAFVDTPRFFDVLHAAKYGHRPDLLAALVSGVRLTLKPPPPAGRILAPLPDDPVRRAERGYSVTCLVADALSDRLGARVRTDLLVRRRAAPAQAKLTTKAAREANVAGLFGVGRLAEVPDGAELILVEDQVTSGATVAAAARLAGARGHPVLALALGGARDAPRQVVA